MAYPILGTPKPAFFDSSGSPLASGTITVQDPDDSSAKASYPTAADADAQTNGTTSAITLDSRGEPSSTQLWGRDGEDYKVIIKDSAGSTVYTLDEIRLPIGLTNVSKVKTADESLTDTTLAADTHLKDWELATNTYYKITGYLLVAAAGATQDLKMDFSVTQSLQDSSYSWISVDTGSALTVDQGEVQTITTNATVDIDGTGNVGISLSGFLFTNASATTNLDFRAAQGTDSGTTTLKKGSWIKIEPLVT